MSSPLNVLIVEDDPSVRLDLEIMLEELGHSKQIADNAKDVFRLMTNKFDVIIMDIYIKGQLNGIQVAEQIKDLNIPIIFITSHKDKTLFETAKYTTAIAFLVKPFDILTLRSVLEWKFSLVLNEENKQSLGNASFFVKGAIFIKANRSYHKVLNQDILWVDAELNYVIIHTENDKRYALKKSLTALQKDIVEPSFLRIHKSHLVNLNRVTQVDLINNQLYISENVLPIGRTYQKKLITRLKLIG